MMISCNCSEISRPSFPMLTSSGIGEGCSDNCRSNRSGWIMEDTSAWAYRKKREEMICLGHWMCQASDLVKNPQLIFTLGGGVTLGSLFRDHSWQNSGQYAVPRMKHRSALCRESALFLFSFSESLSQIPGISSQHYEVRMGMLLLCQKCSLPIHQGHSD